MPLTLVGMCWAAAAAIVIGTALLWPASAQQQTAVAEAPAAQSQAPEPLSDDELEELVAPIPMKVGHS